MTATRTDTGKQTRQDKMENTKKINQDNTNSNCNSNSKHSSLKILKNNMKNVSNKTSNETENILLKTELESPNIQHNVLKTQDCDTLRSCVRIFFKDMIFSHRLSAVDRF